jgi:SMI1 / KNR4 family (SUKH-1)
MARKPKLKPADALPTLIRLGAERAVYLAPKASEAAIRRMQAAAKRDLGEPVPDSYVALLRIANGMQIQGAVFKEAENLVPENLDINHPEVIVLGNDGNMAYYVFDKRDRRFHTINLGFPDERFESYDSFEEMLIGVLKEQGVC